MKPSIVIFDADCGVCQRTRALVEALDWAGAMRWVPNTSAEAVRSGIDPRALAEAVHLITPGGARYRGYPAVKQIVLRLPAFWAFLAAPLLSRRPLLLAPIALLFSPLFEAAGESAYRWVANNRYRVPGSICPPAPREIMEGK